MTYRKNFYLNERETLPQNPLTLFHKLWELAITSDIAQPETMALATSTLDGRVSARMVLLKHYDEKGFQFFTSYRSRKGQQIDENPRAAMVIFWKELGIQIRAEGKIEKTSPEVSDQYFFTRSPGSNIGVWASQQSGIATDRKEMEDRYKYYRDHFRQNTLQRPEYWGGYLLVPDMVEFWQERGNRFHDRIEYKKEADRWITRRLYP